MRPFFLAAFFFVVFFLAAFFFVAFFLAAFFFFFAAMLPRFAVHFAGWLVQQGFEHPDARHALTHHPYA
jgi:hypothetical protein